jgi:raffinose/stachyose/melibiose transport system permease protein
MARIRVLPRRRQHRQSDDTIPPKPFDWYKWMTIVLFTLPGFIILFTFIIGPAYKSVEYSQYKWRGLEPIEELDEDDHLGTEQYKIIYEREDFRGAVNHTLRLIGLGLIIQLPLAMGLAVVIGRGKLLGGKFFRTIIFVPFVFSEPLTAIIWSRVLHPNQGMLNTVFKSIIPGFENQAWLGDTNINLYVIFMVLTWRYFGLHMILYMAALQNVPKDLEEAARIDGANEFNVLRKITLPLIAPTIRLTIYLSVIGAAQQFIIIQILTDGGPFVGRVGSTEVIGTYLNSLRANQRLGRASAVAVILFVAIFVFSIAYQLIFMRRDFKNEKEAARGIRA